jgi:diguanylate cyclase (GGDEF)-like protein
MPGFDANTAAGERTSFERLVSELARQQAHLEVILACMSQGIALFDVNQRLLVSNRRYMNIYGVREELAAPGIPIQDIIRHRINAGAYPEPEQESNAGRYMAMAQGTTPSPQLFRLRDGRMISVNCHALESGGWLSTHDDVTEMWALQQEVEHMAYHDQLTGLGNRRLLEDRLQAACKEAKAGRESVLVLIDLDGFKAVNDEHGHQAGDKLLQTIAERLKERAGDAFAARLGGDEFAVLLQDRQDDRGASGTAQCLIDGLQEPYEIGGFKLDCGVSAGLTIIGRETESMDQAIGEADKALYMSKRSGKGRMTPFSAAVRTDRATISPAHE